MNKYGIASALILIILGILIVHFFSVEYPCTISGCGCDSIWEMLHDTWASLVGFILVVSGMFLFVYSLCPEEKKVIKK